MREFFGKLFAIVKAAVEAAKKKHPGKHIYPRVHDGKVFISNLCAKDPVQVLDHDIVYLNITPWTDADVGQCCEQPHGAWVLREEAEGLLDAYVATEKAKLNK